MTNKKILLGMLAIALVFGMTVIGCDLLPNGTEDENPYKGEFGGTFGLKTNTAPPDAKINFTDTTWTLTFTGTGTQVISQSGTYTRGAAGSATLLDGSYEVATCLLLVDSLVVTFTTGDYKNYEGNFTRVKEPPFSGASYSGTMTKTGNSTSESATISFTDTSWTLTIGTKTVTGTYKKTSDYTVTLDQGSYSNIGNCRYLNKELTVSITNGEFKDYSGKFTRNTTTQ